MENSQDPSLKEILQRINRYFKFIASYRLAILLITVLTAIAGAFYAYRTKPAYTAELSFVLEEDKSSGSLGGALSLASQFGIDLGGGGGGAFSGDNILELMKSRSIIQKVLQTTLNIDGKKRTLVEFYLDIYDLKKAWSPSSSLNEINFRDTSQRALAREKDSIIAVIHSALIKNHLVVGKNDKKLDIISVKVSSIDEIFSKYFTECLVNEVSNFYIETRTKKASQNLAILKHQTDSVRNALNFAIRGVASSIDVNPNPNSALQVLRVPSQRKNIDVQANQAILVELVKNLEIAKVSLRKETPLIQIIDRPIYPLQKRSFSILKGIIFGGLLGIFLTTFFLVILKFRKDLVEGLRRRSS